MAQKWIVEIRHPTEGSTEMEYNSEDEAWIAARLLIAANKQAKSPAKVWVKRAKPS